MVHAVVEQFGPWTAPEERMDAFHDCIPHAPLWPFLSESEIREEMERQEALRIMRQERQPAAPLRLRARWTRRLLRTGVDAAVRYGLVFDPNTQPFFVSYSKAERSWLICQARTRNFPGLKVLCWRDQNGDYQAGKVPMGIGSERDARLFLQNVHKRRVMWHPASHSKRDHIRPQHETPCRVDTLYF